MQAIIVYDDYIQNYQLKVNISKLFYMCIVTSMQLYTLGLLFSVFHIAFHRLEVAVVESAL